MAGQVRTVQNLVEEVRSLLDEDDTVAVNDTADILPSLNRAQAVAANILSRHYDSPLLKTKIISTSSGQSLYPIPEDAFEERLEKVECAVGSSFYPVKRISYRDISLYETSQATSIPYYYTVIGNQFKVLPGANGQYDLRVWYHQDPAPLVLPQGQITSINTASNYVLVDSVGSSLTTESDQLNSYVNLIDGRTGRIKATMQIQSIQDTQIVFKTVPTRTTVLDTPVSSDLSALVDSEGLAVVVEQDDYLCTVKGSCIPFFKNPFSNYLVQYAIAEIRRKLGDPSDMEERVKADLFQLVERSWVGREQSLRVSRQNSKWGFPIRRFWSSGN